MADIVSQIEALERQYEAALRAEAVAKDRADQAREAEQSALARLAELGFPSVEEAEAFIAQSQQAIQQQVAALSAELRELPS